MDVQEIAADRFAAPGRDVGRPRPFGGLVLAQALVAAGRTVPAGHVPLRLHATFLGAGRPGEPTEYHVERQREGDYPARQITARQQDRTTLIAAARFGPAAPAPDSGVGQAAPEPPESARPVDFWLARDQPAMSDWAATYLLHHPLEVRFVSEPPPAAARRGPRAGSIRYWARPAGELASGPLLHAAAVTYASDLMPLTAALLRHGRSLTSQIAAISLDHAMWYHRGPMTGGWKLFEADCRWTGGGRALASALSRDRDGSVVASAMQEGLLRF